MLIPGKQCGYTTLESYPERTIINWDEVTARKKSRPSTPKQNEPYKDISSEPFVQDEESGRLVRSLSRHDEESRQSTPLVQDEEDSERPVLNKNKKRPADDNILGTAAE